MLDAPQSLVASSQNDFIIPMTLPLLCDGFHGGFGERVHPSPESSKIGVFLMCPTNAPIPGMGALDREVLRRAAEDSLAACQEKKR